MTEDMKRKMYIKLYYSLLDWEWYKEPNTCRVFIHLLLTANRKNQNYKGGMIMRGDVYASMEQIAIETGLSLRNVRTALENLMETHEIIKRKLGAVNVYHIVNFERWQDGKGEDYKSVTNTRQASDKVLTDTRQTSGSEMTALRECNNEEKERLKAYESPIHARGTFENVFITDFQYEKFKQQYSFADDVIDQLSAKIKTGNPRYQTGHLGHLYVFAQFYKPKTAERTASYDIDLAMKKALELDPTKTKRT